MSNALKYLQIFKELREQMYQNQNTATLQRITGPVNTSKAILLTDDIAPVVTQTVPAGLGDANSGVYGAAIGAAQAQANNIPGAAKTGVYGTQLGSYYNDEETQGKQERISYLRSYIADLQNRKATWMDTPEGQEQLSNYQATGGAKHSKAFADEVDGDQEQFINLINSEYDRMIDEAMTELKALDPTIEEAEYEFGDITESIIGGGIDLGLGAVETVGKVIEGAVDLGMHTVALGADVLGADETASKIRNRASVDDVDNAFRGVKGYKPDIFQTPGAFKDGYDFGDVTKTILGSATEAGSRLIQGAAKFGEGIIDFGVHAAGWGADLLGEGAELVGWDSGGELFRSAADKLHSGASVDSVGASFSSSNKFLEGYSVFGNTTDAVMEGVGQVGATMATAGMGAFASYALMGASSMGSGMGEAYSAGASDWDAFTYGLIAGAADTATEMIFGGMGKTVNMLGFSKGLTSADDMLAKKISGMFASQLAKNVAEFGVKASAEGLEEVLAGVLQAWGKSVTYMSEKDFSEILADENLLEQFIVGAITSGIAQGGGLYKANKTGTDFVTGFDQTEQKVINREVARLIEQAEKDGTKLTSRQKSEIKAQVEQGLEKGYISVDTIEEVLGGEGYKTYTDTVANLDALQSEYDNLYNMKPGDKSDAQVDRQKELKQQIENIKKDFNRDQAKMQLSDQVYDLVKNSRLAESYNELARKHQAFQADLSKYDKKQQKVIQRAIDSGILNNTNRTHEFVDLIAKISADKGVPFDFTNNQKLKESGFAIDGKQVNGFVTKDGITLNVNSAKALNKVVGHEIAHVLEGTELYTEMQQAVYDYAITKGEWRKRYDALKSLYKDVKDADVKAELTADLVGDYLFTDQDFINNLSVNHRNLFQKVFDEIKYLLKISTAGSKEARQLEKAKKAFAEAYRASKADSKAQKNTANDGGTKYHISENFSVEIDMALNGELDSSSQVKARDFTPEILVRNGVSDLPMLITQNHVKSIIYTESEAKAAGLPTNGDTNYHGLGKDLLIRSIDSMDDPAAIYKQSGNRFVIITELQDKSGNTIIVPVKIDGKGTYNDVYIDENQILSAYGKKNLQNYLNKNNFELIYEKRGNALNEGVQYSNISDSSDNNIADKTKNVKYSLSDSDGNQLTKEQADYFKDSKMRDADGNLKPMYHGSQNGGFHVFDPAYSDDGTSLFFVDRNDVAMSYSGTSETYEAKTIRTAEDMNNFLAEIGYDQYEAVEKDGKFELLEDGDHVATSDTAQGIYEEFCWYEGVGDGNVNYKVYLNLKNPLEVDAQGNEWNEIQIPKEHLAKFNETVYQTPDPYGYIGTATTRNFAEYANAQGYDGVIFKNILDVGGYGGKYAPHTVAIAFDSNQVKSVANANPTADPDIRFSLSEDSQGREVAKALQSQLQFSKVRDEGGHLIPMYHGTPNGSIAQFNPGTYFTANKEYADRYQNPSASSISTGKTASNPKTFEVYLDIRKPFDITNDAEARRIYIEEYVKGGNAIGINPYLSDAEYAKIKSIDWTEGEDLRDFLTENGYDYDGLVLDEGADGGYGEDVKYRGKSYVIFNAEQAISTEDATLSKPSLSNVGETQKSTGKYNVSGQDIALPSALEDVAPVPQAETATETAETEQNVPITEDVPVVSDEVTEEMYWDDNYSVEQEIDNLAQQMVDLEGQLFEMAEAGQFGDEFNRISEEWSNIKNRLEALEQETIAADEDRLSSLEESSAPPEVAPYYEEQFETTPITKKLENDIARVVRSGLALGNKDMADVHRIIQGYVSGKIAGRDQLFAELKRYNSYTETQSDEDVATAKEYLRTYGLKVDNNIKWMIPDYNTLQRSLFGKIRFSKDGTPVDVLYQEMNSMYPHLFPNSISVPEDQFLRMVDVAKMDSETVSEHEIPDEAIFDVADTIIRSVGEYRQAQNEKAANKHSGESFNSLMKEADKHIPQFSPEAYRRLSERPSVVDPDDISPTFEVETDVQSEVEGQQAFLPGTGDTDVAAQKPTTRKELQQGIIDRFKDEYHVRGYELDDVLANAKNLSTWRTVDNTPQRVMEKALGYKEGQILADLTVNKVAQNETEGIKWLNSFTDRKNGVLAQLSKRYHIKPGSKESAAAQMYAEGFYVDDKDNIISYGDAELAADFKNPVVRARIKNLAKDPKIRKIYDETLAAINESRKRNGYPEIPRLDNYFLHFRAQTDTFSRIGLPFNPNDIRAKDLPTDLNGVTADLKPGQPYFASAMHRRGKRTSFDLLGGLEQYLTSAKNQIYHIDDIQNLRALRNYIADTYGQANGLEGLGELSEEEQQDRIEKVYDAHLSTFAKFLNEEANVLAGKTALIDRGLEGIIGRRGITFLDTLNRQVGSNMVGFNVSSSLTNFLAVAQAAAKANKIDFVRAFGQTAANKVGSVFGRTDSFTENSPVVIRRKGADRFHRTPFQKVGDAGYVLMGAVDNISTELIARTKYNELTRKGMDAQQAHYETDKWVSRLMGDRSLGQMPQLYNSKMLGLVTKFQLEVRNQLDSQFYDTIQETKASNEQIENGLLKNAKTAAKVASTFFQLAVAQHLFGKVFESVAGYNPAFDIIEVMMKAFGFDDDEESEDTVLDNLEQGFMALLEDLPYTSTFLDGGRIPISSALPISELVTGEDSYGQEKSRWETLAEIAPYYILPGGYGQAKKTYQGLSMFDEDHPIAGSYTDNGELRFPVEDTLGNRVQAAIFGQWASENANEYFDQERKPLNEKQIQEFIDVGMTIQDYWAYRDGLKGLTTLAEKADYINSLDLTDEQKNVLINNIAGRKEDIDMSNYDEYSDFEEFDYAMKNPEKYQFLMENGVSMEDYRNFSDDQKEAYTWAYNNPDKFTLSKSVTSDLFKYRQYTSELYDIKADKDRNGKSISGSRKEKVVTYINGLDIDYGAKIILFKSEYPADDTYNSDIIDYLNSRDDISYEEMTTILLQLGFTIDPDGVTIRWD